MAASPSVNKEVKDITCLQKKEIISINFNQQYRQTRNTRANRIIIQYKSKRILAVESRQFLIQDQKSLEARKDLDHLQFRKRVK